MPKVKKIRDLPVGSFFSPLEDQTIAFQKVTVVGIYNDPAFEKCRYLDYKYGVVNEMEPNQPVFPIDFNNAIFKIKKSKQKNETQIY